MSFFGVIKGADKSDELVGADGMIRVIAAKNMLHCKSAAILFGLCSFFFAFFAFDYKICFSGVILFDFGALSFFGGLVCFLFFCYT